MHHINYKKKFEKKPRSVISNRELVNIALNNISNDQFYAFEKIEIKIKFTMVSILNKLINLDLL